MYYNFSNKVTITYPMCSDIIVYDCVQPEGHPIINTGNNGFYYPCVAEIVSGKGSTVYHYQVVSPSSTTDNYPYWLNGLLTEKQMYNVDGELLKELGIFMMYMRTGKIDFCKYSLLIFIWMVMN